MCLSCSDIKLISFHSENSNFRTSGSNSSGSSGYGGKLSLSLPSSDQKDNKYVHFEQ